MTREEAKKVLENLKEHTLNYQSGLALDVAISALSENKGDLISRQAVLDGIEELKKSPWATDTRGTGFEYLIAESLDTVRDLVVKPIPTAKNKGEWKRTYLDHVAMGERPSILYCSVCCQCIAYPTNYCPNCGADMRPEPYKADMRGET